MERTGTGIDSLHFAIGSHRDVDVEVLVGTDVSILLQEELLVVASIQEGPHAQYPTPSLARLCNIHEPRHDASFLLPAKGWTDGTVCTSLSTYMWPHPQFQYS